MVDTEDETISQGTFLLATNSPTACVAKSEESKSIWRDSTARQKILLLLIIFGHAVVFMCVSTPFPFMAKVIVSRGGTPEESSLVVQLVMVVMAVSSAFFGKYQVYFGTKPLFLGGLLCFGIGQAVFGVLELAKDSTTIVIAGSIIRIFQGCGQGAYLVAALTIICQEFPDHAGTAFGIAETFASTGYTCGPLLGSVLFTVSNGILLPFIASSLLIIPMFPAANCLLKSYEKESNTCEDFQPTKLFTNPIAILILGVVLSTYGSFGIIDSLSVIYLIPLGFNVVEVGLAMLVMSVTYSIVSVIVGFVSSYGNKMRRIILVFGFLGMCAIPFLFTPTLPKVWAYTAMALLGLLCGLTLISSFSELLHIAVDGRVDLKKKFAMHSALSGVWNFMFGVGGFTFPIIASSLFRVTRFGLAVFMSYMIGIGLTVIVVSIIFVWQHGFKSTLKR